MNDSSKQRSVVIFILAIAIFFLPTVFDLFGDNANFHFRMQKLVRPSFYALLFSVNYFWVIPYLLIKRGKRLSVFFVNLLFIATGCLLLALTMDGPHPGHIPGKPFHPSLVVEFLHTLIFDGVTMFLVVALTYTMRITITTNDLHRQNLEMQNRQRELEIKSLKTQLNPHFLFNTLNNIYALISFDGEKAQKAIHDLSAMLRFSIYEGDTPTVPLNKEISFLKSYIELMKLRISADYNLQVNISNDIDDTLPIPPMFLLTLVENAFKHGNIGEKDSFIKVEIRMEEREELVCYVANSYNPESVRKGEEGGVGLANIRKQLELLYPEKSSLAMLESDGVYAVTLRIRLV
jgi:sensor histidine kinase YesM